MLGVSVSSLLLVTFFVAFLSEWTRTHQFRTLTEYCFQCQFLRMLTSTTIDIDKRSIHLTLFIRFSSFIWKGYNKTHVPLHTFKRWKEEKNEQKNNKFVAHKTNKRNAKKNRMNEWSKNGKESFKLAVQFAIYWFSLLILITVYVYHTFRWMILLVMLPPLSKLFKWLKMNFYQN